jgi:hypothetical protein
MLVSTAEAGVQKEPESTHTNQISGTRVSWRHATAQCHTTCNVQHCQKKSSRPTTPTPPGQAATQAHELLLCYTQTQKRGISLLALLHTHTATDPLAFRQGHSVANSPQTQHSTNAVKARGQFNAAPEKQAPTKPVLKRTSVHVLQKHAKAFNQQLLPRNSTHAAADTCWPAATSKVTGRRTKTHPGSKSSNSKQQWGAWLKPTSAVSGPQAKPRQKLGDSCAWTPQLFNKACSGLGTDIKMYQQVLSSIHRFNGYPSRAQISGDAESAQTCAHSRCPDTVARHRHMRMSHRTVREHRRTSARGLLPVWSSDVQAEVECPKPSLVESVQHCRPMWQ